MLTVQNIESELSYAYLHAIASRGGIICECTGRHSDEAGVDAVLRVKGRLSQDSKLTQFSVDVQLKATKQMPVEQNGRYSYSLKAKNYNELRSAHTGAPQLLIVLFLPADSESWLVHSEECLVTRRCAYWLSLRGAPEIDQDSRTVYIPRVNELSVPALRALMTRFSTLEVVNYGG
ncbi:MAG: DUF4365 domain-containing protein [Planctomycetaceae bacterium]|nr:MAG: DUF4365 domain-containing protein [Planctomycetaceae bacterium]